MKVILEKKYWCKCNKSRHPHKKVKNKDNHGRGDFEGYSIKEINYCCLEMEEAMDNYFIGFGHFEFGGYLGENTNINIYFCNNYPEGAVWRNMGISYCPFCAKHIRLTLREDDK